MNIVIDIVLLLAGFVLLIKGADFFVEGASSLARKLRIPSLVVGLTIVALGTSAPELAVSISASLGGQNSMAVSNVVGSNIFNLLWRARSMCAGNTPWSYKRHTSSRLSGFDIHIRAVFCNAYILRSFRRDHYF